MRRFLATGLIPFLVLLAIALPGQAVGIRDDISGGDCTLVGNWDAGTRTCQLTSDLGDGVFVLSPDITIDCDGFSLSGLVSAALAGISAFPGTDGMTVTNCQIRHFNFGIIVFGSKDQVIADNHIHHNGQGILVIGSSNSLISGNRIEDNGFGANLVSSENLSITNNAFFRNRHSRALHVADSTNNVVAFNTFTDNSFGITLHSSSSNEIHDNLFVDNGFPQSLAAGDAPTVALGGEESDDNVLTNNVMVDNVYGFGLQGTGNTVDISNTVDGHPIYWFNDLAGTTITPELAPGAAGVFCDRCTGVTIRGFELTVPMGIGIGLYETSESSVENNVIRNSSLGVLLTVDSGDSIVRDNVISLDFEDVFAFGIRLFGSDGNLISGNRIDLGPGNSGWHGISVGRHIGAGFQDPADWNTVSDNVIKRVLQPAIEVGGSHNLIVGNTLTDTGGGIAVEGFGVDKVDNTIQGNVIRDGRDAWFPFAPFPGGFGHGIGISNAVDTLITRNSVMRMRDSGLRILGSFGTAASRNDFFDNAQNGIDNEGKTIFEVASVDSSGANPAAIELSVDGVGNYWGRNCGLGNTTGSPLFQAGVDSNSPVVVDSNPFGHPISDLEGTEGLIEMACPTKVQ